MPGKKFPRKSWALDPMAFISRGHREALSSWPRSFLVEGSPRRAGRRAGFVLTPSFESHWRS